MREPRGLHWESWFLRLVILGTFVFQVLTHNKDGASVAGEGVVVSLLPLLVQKLSRTHVPRALEFAFVLGMGLQFISESTKLFEIFTYWDKIVHPTLVALTAMVAGWFLLGYRDSTRGNTPTHLLALGGWLIGASVGAFWEFIEFGTDWFSVSDLQKSNGDTMTDMISNDIGALIATLIGFWIYHHHMSERQHTEIGQVGAWLANGPRRLADSHGPLLAAVAVLLIGGLLGASQWIDRNRPALASGLAPGQSQEWNFSNASNPPDPDQVLAGTWAPDPNAGLCRLNMEDGEVPKPGSEKMGLLALAPGTAYGGADQSFSLTAHYFEERPPKIEGTQMDAGVAFGIRDKDDFYLLEENALHDILRLDRYIHGKRRDVREKLYRTHGNEWHTLRVNVQGETVEAIIDDHPVYRVSDLEDTSGGIGLYGRTSASSCFDDASVQINSVNALVPQLKVGG